MSERILLAERGRDEPYECFRSQFADTSRLLRASTERDPTDLRQGGTWDTCGQTDWQTLVDELSYLNLDLCIRRDGPDVTAYLPVWAGIPTGERDETPDNCGVLVRVDSPEGYERVRRRVGKQKARLGTAIEAGDIDTATAQRRLLAPLRGRVEHGSGSARRPLDGE